MRISVRTELNEAGMSTGLKTSLIWSNDTRGVFKESNQGPAIDDPGDSVLGGALQADKNRLAARRAVDAENTRQGEITIP